MNIILFDDHTFSSLLPLTYTRPISEIRCGITTLKQKWEYYAQQFCSYHTHASLQELFPTIYQAENIFINASIFPSSALWDTIKKLPPKYALTQDQTIIAINLPLAQAQQFSIEKSILDCTLLHTNIEFKQINTLWDIFSLNDWAIRTDFEILDASNNKAEQISTTNTLIGNNVFIEEGVNIEACILNSNTGPIYLGKNTQVLEGCMIRGPFAMGENSVLKMGAKIYGATTLGNGCKVGGEVNNAVFFDNSNKSHDGYIGNSVIGEWCNLGADTNNSNLKNNYEEVKLWSEAQQTFVKTGLQFCGLIMADHSKCGINTMFNTGTVVGVSCNIFGAGFPRNFVPSFSWGGAQGFTEYKLEKAILTIENVFARRNKKINSLENKLIESIFTVTQMQRKSY